jgi:hypothetical protein
MEPSIIIQGLTISQFNEMFTSAIEQAVQTALLNVETDPFKGCKEIMWRKDIRRIFNRSDGWIRNKAITINAANTSEQKIDYTKYFVEYKDGNKNPYYKTKEVRQYYNRMKSEKGIGS